MVIPERFVVPKWLGEGGFARESELSGFCSVGTDRVSGAVCRNTAQCESLGASLQETIISNVEALKGNAVKDFHAVHMK